MNVENILKVADAIEQHSIPDLGFNMASYYDKDATDGDKSGHDCGTTACIGGWACAVGGRYEEMKKSIYFSASEFTQRFFDLSEDDAYELMLGTGFERKASQDEAVRTLRHLAATGIVDWNLPEA